MAVYDPTHFLHGGDYNPEQWLKYPETLAEDIRLMKEAHVNTVSVGIFSWAFLEPEEGRYDFAWLDQIIDQLTGNGIGIILATPSGARPAWMAQKYPEVLRWNQDFQQYHFGERHNHCLTSPVYREKVRAIDSALAEHYANHPGILMWHISNEFSGDCHCPLCQQAFRDWLREKYGTLEALNDRWWTGFWSQRYSAWEQIEPPSPMGEISNPSMKLDWRRFETEQCRSFIAMERDAVHAFMPEVPVTINLMDRFRDYDYFTLGTAVDVISWDAYPSWGRNDIDEAAAFAMQHDLMRSFKKQPFLLMESTPSLVNWKPVNKLKRPGMHLLSSMQAVAHGSQSVLMFQWRKGRGGAEAFHGAVVSHDGRSDTRVFQDVKEVGMTLEALTPVLAEAPEARVCIIYDYENRWALEEVQAAHRGNMKYTDTVQLFYRSLWEKGIAADFRDMHDPAGFEGYDLVIAPMLFLFRDGIEEKLRTFTEAGGTILTTFFSGAVNEDDLAFLGDAPHGLTDVLGLRAEELDALYPGETNELVMDDGQRLTLRDLCEIPRDVTAEVIGRYGTDFYAGLPCLTRNRFGKGTAWYLAARPDQAGVNSVMERVLRDLNLPQALDAELPEGVTAGVRGDYVFLQNYGDSERTIRLPHPMRNAVTGEPLGTECKLPPKGIVIVHSS